MGPIWKHFQKIPQLYLLTNVFQVTVFLNMPSLLSNVTWVDQVMDVVENCLIDERVEVRSKAGQVLSGLLHCAFVDKPRHDSLLVSIRLKAKWMAPNFLSYVS
jgi:hypothetical protein